jgi:hypothetical protein
VWFRAVWNSWAAGLNGSKPPSVQAAESFARTLPVSEMEQKLKPEHDRVQALPAWAPDWLPAGLYVAIRKVKAAAQKQQA